MIGYDIDPFHIILDAVNDLFPGVDAGISFQTPDQFQELYDRLAPIKGKKVPGKDLCGFCVWDADGKTPLIVVNQNIPCFAAVEIIAHEVAHLVAGPEAEHGKEWEKVFKKIRKHYGKLHAAACAALPGK